MFVMRPATLAVMQQYISEPLLGALMLGLSHLAAPWLTETDKTSDSSPILE